MSGPLERVLFIGGPRDGTWGEVLQGSTIYEVNYSPPLSALGEIPAMTTMTTITRIHYLRQGWQVARESGKLPETRYIFVAHGYTPAQIFDKLLQCYSQQSDAFAEKQQLEQELKVAQQMLAALNKVLQRDQI